MVAVIVLAILAIALFGFGFAVHVLWWVAIAALVLMVLSLIFRGGGRSSVPR